MKRKAALQSVILRCDECHVAQEFTGPDVDAILKAVDAAKWHDRPGGALCPTCDAEADRQYAEESRWY